MKIKIVKSSLMALATAGVLGLSTGTQAADVKYHFLKEIPVGGDGGWDYLSVDPDAHRLYVSHGTKIVVIDTAKNEVVGEISDTPGVHGFAIAPESKHGFSSNGREAKCNMVDLETLKVISKVETGQNPDAIIYEPGKQEVYAFNGRGSSATVIDAKTGKVVATIPLAGKPEFAAADPKAGRVYCNLEDKNQIAVIDTKEHKVLENWSIAPGEEASGMAIDVAHHRLFIGCHNKIMEMIDTKTGKVIGSVPIGSGVDANAFDPGTQLAFSSNGDATVTIAQEDGDKLTLVQNLVTEPRMRTMTIDTKTHRIYLAAAKYEAQADQPAGAARQRPKMIPGSFKIMVYGMEK